MVYKSILIIGSGVSGLTCGIRLLEEGFRVKIIASELPPNTTSNIAPAYWYPYKVYPEKKVLEWGQLSYKKYEILSNVKETGVSFIKLFNLYDKQIPKPGWLGIVRKFNLATIDMLPKGYTHGFISEVPLIETPVYIDYLYKKFIEYGGKVQRLHKKLDSFDEVYDLSNIIVNCTGLGSHKLCSDKEVFPIRGQLVRTTNPGIDYCYNDEEGPLAMTYIVPRSNDCVLGGTTDEGNWSLDIDDNTTKKILKNSMTLVPNLKGAQILEVKVGLRPGRTEVRLEVERLTTNCTVIHNYGHGGAGITLSWGCAEEVLDLVSKVMKNN